MEMSDFWYSLTQICNFFQDVYCHIMLEWRWTTIQGTPVSLLSRPVARWLQWVQLHPLQVSLHPLALRFAPSVLKVLQRVQSKALEGEWDPQRVQLHPEHPSGYGPASFYLLERKRVCCRPAMDVRRAGPTNMCPLSWFPRPRVGVAHEGAGRGTMQSVDVLTRSRRDSAGGTPIRRSSAGAKHDTIDDCDMNCWLTTAGDLIKNIYFY